MIMLFIGWFESRITFYSHTSRHTEPNIEDPIIFDKFYLTVVAGCVNVDSVIFCTNNGSPDIYSSWDCKAINDSYYDNKDHPWVVAVGNYHVFVVYNLVSTDGILVMETFDGGISWIVDTVLYHLGEDPLVPYAYYNGTSLYIAAESYNVSDSAIYIRVWKYDNLTSWEELRNPASSFRFVLGDYTTRFCRYPSGAVFKGLYGITSSVDGAVAVVYLLQDNIYNLRDTCRVYVSTTSNDGNIWVVRKMDRIGGYEHYTPTIASSPYGRIWTIWQECDLFLENCRTVLSTTRSYSSPSWSSPSTISSHIYKFWRYEAAHHYNDAEWDNDMFYLHVVWGNDSSATGGQDVWYARNDWYHEEVKESAKDHFKPKYIPLKGGIILKDVGKVYSIDGRLVFRGKGRVVLPRGVYFVKSKDKVFKVILR